MKLLERCKLFTPLLSWRSSLPLQRCTYIYTQSRINHHWQYTTITPLNINSIYTLRRRNLHTSSELDVLKQPERINGKKFADEILQEVCSVVKQLPKKPFLSVFCVGNNPASASYIAMKQRACNNCGIHSRLKSYPADITEEDLIQEVKRECNDDFVNGVIVQLPLPDHIDSYNVIQALDHRKDVDGLTSINIGASILERPDAFPAATPRGITELLHRSNISLEGKSVAIVGRSNLVGKPLANMLLRKAQGAIGPTVSVLHTGTPHLAEHTTCADVLVVAAGHPCLIGPSDLKPGVVLIDVGINRIADSSRTSGYRIVGDVDPRAYALCSKYTPVPGGVGPMTVAMLLYNVLKAALQQSGQ